MRSGPTRLSEKPKSKNLGRNVAGSPMTGQPVSHSIMSAYIHFFMWSGYKCLQIPNVMSGGKRKSLRKSPLPKK